MIVAYRELPGEAGAYTRPLLDVVVSDVDDIAIRCLVDSGALNCLLPRWMSDAAGIPLEDAEPRTLAIATTRTDARFVTTTLTAAGSSWETSVGFCDPWPYRWGILGQRSFFRFFTVTLRAADSVMELEPISR